MAKIDWEVYKSLITRPKQEHRDAKRNARDSYVKAMTEINAKFLRAKSQAKLNAAVGLQVATPPKAVES